MPKYSDITLKRGYIAATSSPTAFEVAGLLSSLINLWNNPNSGPSRAKSAIQNLAAQGTAGEATLFAIRQSIQRSLWEVKDAKTKNIHQELSTAISRFVRKK